MKNAILLVIVWAVILALASGVVSLRREQEVEYQVFEFSSGSAYDIEGYGEWAIRTDTEGTFSVTHDVQGEIADYGSFSLSDEESLELWRHIREIAIEELHSSDRLGLPDENAYRFMLRDSGQAYSVSLWIEDARKYGQIVALVEQLAVLIEKKTGEEPVLH